MRLRRWKTTVPTGSRSFIFDERRTNGVQPLVSCFKSKRKSVDPPTCFLARDDCLRGELDSGRCVSATEAIDIPWGYYRLSSSYLAEALCPKQLYFGGSRGCKGTRVQVAVVKF